jgi:hypothetical protein
MLFFVIDNWKYFTQHHSMNLIRSYDDSDEEDERPLKKARIELDEKIETILVTQKVLNEMLDAPPTLPFESTTSDAGSSWHGYIYLRGTNKFDSFNIR